MGFQQTAEARSWRVITRVEILIVGAVGGDPAQYALHSGRVGGRVTRLSVADPESGPVENRRHLWST